MLVGWSKLRPRRCETCCGFFAFNWVWESAKIFGVEFCRCCRPGLKLGVVFDSILMQVESEKVFVEVK